MSRLDGMLKSCVRTIGDGRLARLGKGTCRQNEFGEQGPVAKTFDHVHAEASAQAGSTSGRVSVVTLSWQDLL